MNDTIIRKAQRAAKLFNRMVGPINDPLTPKRHKRIIQYGKVWVKIFAKELQGR
jgi:hypothetical protein